eukprot:557574_1
MLFFCARSKVRINTSACSVTIASIHTHQYNHKLIMFGVSYPDDDDVLGWVFVSIVSFNLLLLIFLHLAESYPSYSKLYDQGFAKSKCAPEFLKNTNINYRMGFFLCYFPAMLAAPIVAIVTIFVNNTDDVFLTSYAVYFWINACLLTVHFAKRSFETLFVHVYSRKVGNLASFSLIWIWYICIAVASSYSLVTDLDTKGNIGIESNLILYCGVIVFVCGELLNFYAHWTLASSRGQNGDNKYATLEELGALFKILVAPHYYGDLLAFFGIFIAMRSLSSLLCFVAVCVNLAWRTFQTVQWYKNESKRKVQRNSETTSTQIDP